METIKMLRERTGAPLGDVKSALEQAGGDELKAQEVLKKKGFESALKRQGRTGVFGLITNRAGCGSSNVRLSVPASNSTSKSCSSATGKSAFLASSSITSALRRNSCSSIS